MGSLVLAVSATLAMMWKPSFNSSEPVICTSIEPNKIVPENYLTKVLWPKENYVSVWSCKLKLSIPIGFEPAICTSIEHNEIVPETYLNKDYGQKENYVSVWSSKLKLSIPIRLEPATCTSIGLNKFYQKLIFEVKIGIPICGIEP